MPIRTLINYWNLKKKLEPLIYIKYESIREIALVQKILKVKTNSLYAEWPSLMEYETPNYKIYVGNFLTRLEADQRLIES